jgi:hypothetical protein
VTVQVVPPPAAVVAVDAFVVDVAVVDLTLLVVVAFVVEVVVVAFCNILDTKICFTRFFTYDCRSGQSSRCRSDNTAASTRQLGWLGAICGERVCACSRATGCVGIAHRSCRSQRCRQN